MITGGFDSWWAGHGTEIEKVWNAVWATIKDTFDVLWDILIAVGKPGWPPDHRRDQGPAWRPAGDLSGPGGGYISAATRGTWDLISGIVKSAWAIISGVVQIASPGSKSVIKIAWDVIVGIFDVALDLVTGQWGKAWADIKTTVTQVWNAIKGFLGSALSDIEQHVRRGVECAARRGEVVRASDLLGYVKRFPA